MLLSPPPRRAGACRLFPQQQHVACPRAAAARSSASLVTSAPTSDTEGSSSERERNEWVASVRGLMGRRKHRCWQPDALDPPAQLADVAIVLLSTKMPSSIGSVARAASSFECEDLRLVAPRCDPLARSARNSSKGAQYLLWRAREFGSLPEATADAAVTVAFTRWIKGRPQAFRSPGEMYAAAELAQLFHCERRAGGASSTAAAGGGKVVLVFGREEAGLTEEEIAFCDYTCSIPIGRLQESLSLSHAVSVVLSQLFQLRLDYSTLPGTLEELAPGYPLDAAGSEDE